jgi:hypothetical protein
MVVLVPVPKFAIRHAAGSLVLLVAVVDCCALLPKIIFDTIQFPNV